MDACQLALPPTMDTDTQPHQYDFHDQTLKRPANSPSSTLETHPLSKIPKTGDTMSSARHLRGDKMGGDNHKEAKGMVLPDDPSRPRFRLTDPEWKMCKCSSVGYIHTSTSNGEKQGILHSSTTHIKLIFF